MNRPFISMKHGLLGKNHSGDGRVTAVLRYAIVLILISTQLFGLGIGQGLANGPIPRPGGLASPGQPPQVGGVPPSSQAGRVSLNFTGADLVEVIHVLAQYLKLNYTIDPGVRGTVTLYSAQPLRQQDLLPVFHQVLRMNDAVAVKTGEFYHIAPINAGKGMVRPARRLGERGYILQVVPVRFFAVSEIKRLLEPFMTPGGEILEYPRGNFLIILDLATNIQRLLEIKDLIDVNVFAGVRMELYQPKAASAEELADEMDRIMQAYAASATQAENFVARFIPVPRINRLLVISHSEAAWSYAMRWLERIDTYAEGPGRRIFVYPVENGKAVDLADILNQVLGQGSTGGGAARKTLRDVAERIAGGQSQTPSGGSSSAGQSGAGTGQSGSLYAVAPAQAPSPQTRPPAEAGAEGAGEQVRIVPDPATNSLIIFGTAQEFRNIRNILNEIDIVPRQVLMDVMIAEVTLSDDFRFGVEYQILRDPDTEIFGRDFDQHVSILSGLPGALPGGAGPQALSMIIGTGDDIRGFINARREDSRVKVLSSPTILATDNQPARIQVGTEEPIATGTVTSPVSTGVTSSTTIQYRNTGRILTIIPQVNAQGLVNLQVKTEVSQRGASVTVGQDSFPSFDTRDAETTAVVQDGETLAIGGIITERVNRGRVGIPFLMDIPVFGRFFGTTTDDVDRTELIMLITPHVIRNKEEARVVTEEFKNVLSGVVREYGWEIQNMQRYRKRDLEPAPEKTPTVEPQSSITPQQQEPQRNARKATIVVPSDQQAYKSLTSGLASSAPANKLVTPGREVRAPAGSSQQSQVVELGNSSIRKGLELAKATPQSDESNAPLAKVEIPYLEADLTPSAEDQDVPSEKLSTELSEKSLSRLREEFSRTPAERKTNPAKDAANATQVSQGVEQVPTSMGGVSATDKTPLVQSEASGTERKDDFTDELLSAVIRDLEEKQRSMYRKKENKIHPKQVAPPTASIQEGQREPEQSQRSSPVWQEVVSSFTESSSSGTRPTAETVPADSTGDEKVSLSTPGSVEPSFNKPESTSLLEEDPVPAAIDPIAEELLRETSEERKAVNPGITDETQKAKASDATRETIPDDSQTKDSAPRAGIPSVQELKTTLEHPARPLPKVEKPSSEKAKADPVASAKESGPAAETSPSSEDKSTAPAVNTIPEPEPVASSDKENPSNAKSGVERQPTVDIAKKMGVKTATSEKTSSQAPVSKNLERVAPPTQTEPNPDEIAVSSPVVPGPETTAKKAAVTANVGEKPSKEKEQTVSVTKAKAAVTPPQKKTSAKTELAEIQAKQKAPVKTKATAILPTTKSQSTKVAEAKAQNKKKKADTRKNTVRKEQTVSVTKAKTDVTTEQKKSIAREELAGSLVNQKAAAKTKATAVSSTINNQSAKVAGSKKQIKAKTALSAKKQPTKPLAKALPTKTATKSPASEDAKKTKDAGQVAGNSSVEFLKSVAPVKESAPEVVAKDSAVVEKASSQKKTKWSPLGWFSRSKPETPDQDEAEDSTKKLNEVAKVRLSEAANDNFIPSKPTEPPASVKAPPASLVRDNVVTPEIVTSTDTRVSSESESPKEIQKERLEKKATSNAIASSGADQESVPEEMKESKTAQGNEILPEKRSWSLLDLFQSSKRETSTPKDPQESPEIPDKVAKIEATEVLKIIVDPSKEPASSSLEDKKLAPEVASDSEALVSEPTEAPKANESEPGAVDGPIDGIVPSTLEATKTAERVTETSKETGWSPLSWFRRAEPATSSPKQPQNSSEIPEEVGKIGTNEVSNQDAVLNDTTATTVPDEELAQSAFGEVPLPKDAESVTIVSIDKEPFFESVKETQGKGPVEAIIDETEKVPTKKLVRESVSDATIQVDTPKVPVITNEVLEAYNQEVTPVTDSLAPTETPNLEAEIIIPSTPLKPSQEGKKSWFPLGWWSQKTEPEPADQDKIAVSPEEPMEIAQGLQSADETLSQEPGPVLAEELPLTEEIATTDGERTKRQPKTSWSPLNWFSRSESVNSAREKAGEHPESSTELSESDLTDSEKSVPDSTPSLGSTGEEPIREEFVPSTGGEQASLDASVTSSVEGLASSAVGGEASTSVQTDSAAQRWLPTVGIRFESKQDRPERQTTLEQGVTNSSVEEDTFAVRQKVEAPEVVGLVLPFDKEAAKALGETPSGPVESPFTADGLDPIQTSDLEQSDAVVVQADRHIESRVHRFPRANDRPEYEADYSVQPGQKVPMQLARSNAGLDSSESVKTESLARRTENQQSAAVKTLRNATNKNARSSKTGRQGKWSVQIRAFSREGRARSLVNKLQNSGYDAYVVRARVKGRTWYRVRVGHFESKRLAKATLASIRENKTYSQAYVVVNR